jgi:hypothetical protein
MQQLIELRLGSATEKADGNTNTFNANGFKAMLSALKAMHQLTVLDIQLPHVKQIDINKEGTRFLLNLGVGHKGAQFVA